MSAILKEIGALPFGSSSDLNSLELESQFIGWKLEWFVGLGV